MPKRTKSSATCKTSHTVSASLCARSKKKNLGPAFRSSAGKIALHRYNVLDLTRSSCAEPMQHYLKPNDTSGWEAFGRLNKVRLQCRSRNEQHCGHGGHSIIKPHMLTKPSNTSPDKQTSRMFFNQERRTKETTLGRHSDEPIL